MFHVDMSKYSRSTAIYSRKYIEFLYTSRFEEDIQVCLYKCTGDKCMCLFVLLKSANQAIKFNLLADAWF